MAFAPGGQLKDSRRLSITFDIKENYYLYRHALTFTPDSKAIELGEAQFPASKKSRDRWFGDIEIYRDPTRISVPFSDTGEVPERFYVEVGYRGCESVQGVCYPPQKQLLQFIPEQRFESPP